MKYMVRHSMDRDPHTPGNWVTEEELRGIIEQHFPYPVSLEHQYEGVRTNGDVWRWEGDINHWLECNVHDFGGVRQTYHRSTHIRMPLEVDTEWRWAFVLADTYAFQNVGDAVRFKLTWA